MAGSSTSHKNYSAQQTPLGIQQLMALDRVMVTQKTTFAMFKGNKYVVMGPDGNPIFCAKEESGGLGIVFGGKERGFYMDLYDTQNQLVISLRRPYTFGMDKLEVSMCGVVVSVVRQQQTFFKPVLHINSAADQPMLRVKGPVNTSGECDFAITTMEKKQIGVISKKWGGMMREMFTDCDQFLIGFPRDLDVRYKAAILGTCFLIDFLYYEH